MKKLLSTALTVLMIMSPFFGGMTTVIKAEGSPTCTVRVEGLGKTIVEGTGSGSSSTSILNDVLSKNGLAPCITKTSYGSEYVSSINNLTEKHFNGDDGWMFYVKHSNGDIDTPYPYVPVSGDEIIFYYGLYTTSFVNSITFNPTVVQLNQSFKMQFNWNHDIYDSNWNPIPTSSPIAGVNVLIDNKSYNTNENGIIEVKNGLSNGTHTYKISGYKGNEIPTVVMDKGTFTIDGKNSPGFNYTGSSYDNKIKDNTKIIADINKEVSITSLALSKFSNPWISLDMKKLGLNVNNNFVTEISNDIKENGVNSYSNTDLEKSILGLTAVGYTPYNFMGQNLVAQLYNKDIKSFEINDLIFGLCAYNYCNISEKSYVIKKTDLVNAILSKELTSGGWALSGNVIDGDITGMVLNAIAPTYYSNINVKNAVDKSVQSIAKLEKDDGYIQSTNGITSETLSMVIVGLVSIGIDPGEIPFVKSNGNIVQALLSFKGTNGMYKHTINGVNDNIATEEALRAFIVLQNFKKNGSYNFYLSDIDASKLSVYNQTVLSSEVKVNQTNPVTKVTNPINQTKPVTIENNAKIKSSIDSSVIGNDEQKPLSNIAMKMASLDNSVAVSFPSDTIDIPAGYTLHFAENYISGSEADKIIKNITSNLDLVDNAFSLNLSLTSPDGRIIDIHNFKTGKTVKVSMVLKDIKNVDTSKLAAYYYDDANSTWIKVGAQKGSFNSSDNTFTFETSHFTIFAIMQEKVSASKVVIPNKDLVSTNNLIYIGVLLVGLGVAFILIRKKKYNMK